MPATCSLLYWPALDGSARQRKLDREYEYVRTEIAAAIQGASPSCPSVWGARGPYATVLRAQWSGRKVAMVLGVLAGFELMSSDQRLPGQR
jgi:hypothetical protein